MQANSEISVLHLTNDRPNCSGLLLLSTVFHSCWAYYMRVVYLFSGKLLLNVFIQRLQSFFYLCHVFYVFNVFYFGGTFFHL